jgi:hypothetical protein
MGICRSTASCNDTLQEQIVVLILVYDVEVRFRHVK